MTPAPPAQPEPLLDLQRLMVAIRRRRRVWLAGAVVGLFAGIALAVLMPASPTAVTRILVVHEETEGAGAPTLIKTDIALLETTRVAADALKRVGGTDRPENFVNDYEATALTGNVLELKVKGATDADAVARARAVAEAFIADHVKRVQDGAQADAQALIDRRDSAKAQLEQLQKSIDAMSQTDRRDNPTQLDALLNQRNDLNQQVSDLSSRAQEAGSGAPRVAAGTQIVDEPRALPRSFLRSAVLNGGIGFVLALAAGLGLAAVAGVVRDRPVLRREISAQLGASVIAQLREPPRGPSRLWLRGWRAAKRRRVAATLARLVRRDGGSVSLLELGAPRSAAALAMDMATALSADAPVLLVDDLPRGRLAGLLGDAKPGSAVKPAAKPAGDGKRRADAERPIRVVGGAELDDQPRGKERQIGIGSVRSGTAWTDLPRLGAETLLVVRAGHASTLWLHTVARQLADLQIPVIGVVLVDPDRKDQSDGTLWDGLHTAIRGRASATAHALAHTAADAHAATPVRPPTPTVPAAHRPAVPAAPSPIAAAAVTAPMPIATGHPLAGTQTRAQRRAAAQASNSMPAPNQAPSSAQQPPAPAQSRASSQAAATTPPGRSSNGASYSDDYPTETIAPIWPTSDDLEGLVNVTSRRHRKSDG